MRIFKPIKNLFTKLKSTVKKISNIALPHLRKAAKEKLHIPLIRRKINKGLFFVCSFMGIHILEFYITNFFVKSVTYDNENELLTNNPESLGIRFQYVFFPLGTLLVNMAIASMKKALIYHLRMSLEIPLKENILKQWLSHNAITGLPLLQECEQEKLLPIHELFSTRVSCFSRESIAITLGTCSDFVSMIANLYHFGRLYQPDLIAFLVLYGLGMAYTSHKIFNKSYSELSVELNKHESAVNTKVINLCRQGNSTVSFQAQNIELENLKLAIREQEKLGNKNLRLDIQEELINGVFGRMLYPIFFAAYPALNKAFYLNPRLSEIFSQVISNFLIGVHRIINRFNHNLPELEFSLEQIEKFQLMMKKWHQFNNLKLLQQQFKPDHKFMQVRNLKVHIPSKKKGENITQVVQILEKPNLLSGKKNQGVNIDFQIGKVYLFSDESGLGKTTVLKSLLAMFPFSGGSITFPCRPEEVRYVAGNSLNPSAETLLEAITFPHVPTENDEQMAKKLIDEMRLVNAEEIKENLKDKNWGYYEALSAGQKACCAIIGVLMYKPKVLFLDEPLNGLDLPKKEQVEKLIKSILSDAIIFYADHHPISGFANYEVRILEGRLNCTPLNLEDVSPKFGNVAIKTYRTNHKFAF